MWSDAEGPTFIMSDREWDFKTFSLTREDVYNANTIKYQHIFTNTPRLLESRLPEEKTKKSNILSLCR